MILYALSLVVDDLDVVFKFVFLVACSFVLCNAWYGDMALLTRNLLPSCLLSIASPVPCSWRLSISGSVISLLSHTPHHIRSFLVYLPSHRLLSPLFLLISCPRRSMDLLVDSE